MARTKNLETVLPPHALTLKPAIHGMIMLDPLPGTAVRAASREPQAFDDVGEVDDYADDVEG